MEKRTGKKSGSQASRGGPHGPVGYNLDAKQKIYHTNNPLAAQGLGGAPKLGGGAGFNSTKVRTQRFTGMGNLGPGAGLGQLNTTQSPNVQNYNAQGFGQLPVNPAPNTTNNANFQHKQRQLSYSPNMAAGGKAMQNKQGMPGGKKRNTSEAPQPAGSLLGQGIDPLHLGQVPGRRSQSKNDKYKDAEPAPGLTFAGFNPPQKGLSGMNLNAS